jgi:hypothetical protein
VDAGPAVGAPCVAAVAAGSAAAAPAGDAAAGAKLDDPATTIKPDELPCGHLRPAHDLPRLCLLHLAAGSHVGNVLGDIVAGAVAADSDVANWGDSRRENRVMRPWRA